MGDKGTAHILRCLDNPMVNKDKLWLTQLVTLTQPGVAPGQ